LFELIENLNIILSDGSSDLRREHKITFFASR